MNICQSNILSLQQTARMARSLTQDQSERTIGYIDEDEKYVACIMFNFKIVSIISCESDVGKDAYRAYRVEVHPLHVENDAPSIQEVIILCEDIFRY